MKPFRKHSLLALCLPMALAQAAPQGNTPPGLADLRLDTPVERSGTTKVGPGLSAARGTVQVSIRLSLPSLAEARPAPDARAEHLQRVARQQEEFTSSLQAAGGRRLSSVSRALNAIVAEVDAQALPQLATDPRVLSIRAVRNYERHLGETVSHIGALAAQQEGLDGSGISVAVLDSGIDYYHAALGGSGDPADYANDDPTVVEAGTFPTAKVVGGHDFVGSNWPNTELEGDEDPLDDGPEAGHGTHVADIIGGTDGVAPGVDLYAVKVCSSVSTSCSGEALLQAMDYVLDPDGDPTTDDQIDIVNLSLGSDYGQAFDDDLSAAVDNINTMGVTVVASAGNASDKPYIVGAPSAAPSALSVAQTQVPSASLQLIEAEGRQIPAALQPWSVPPGGTLSGPLQYGDTDGSNLNGCAPFNGDLSGTITLVDRGACNFTLKVMNIGDAGGSAGIIGLVAPGAPFAGGDGGDPVTIPGYMISQSDANFLKSIPGSTVTIDPDSTLALVNQMVGSSSRGPTVQFNALAKPEIGAPGASVSAIAGSGTGTGPFGGTSGAAPMVSGAAALLKGGNPDLTPAELRARLVNTAETGIDTDPFTGLAPIARIGGGEVRVDRAAASSVAAWEASSLAATLSFGLVDATEPTSLSKTVTLQNYGSEPVSYAVQPGFRYAEDDNGAVTLTTSHSAIDVPANGQASLQVTLNIEPALLKSWYGNSGALGADPTWLTDLEYDGYLRLDAGGQGNDIHLPWHVLPRKAAAVSLSEQKKKFRLDNNGAGTARIEAYHLIATSEDLPEGPRGGNSPITDFAAVGYRTEQVSAGFCGPTASRVISFAVVSHERQTHANIPNAWDLLLDYDGDGVEDANLYNFELAGDLSDGRNVVFASADLVNYSAFFFTDHETNSAVTVLTVCAEQIGLSTGQVHDAIQMALGGAFDLYFQGAYTDFFGSVNVGGPGVDDSPVTFQGNHSGVQLLPPGGSVSGTRGKSEPTLLLIRGGAPEGREYLLLE